MSDMTCRECERPLDHHSPDCATRGEVSRLRAEVADAKRCADAAERRWEETDRIAREREAEIHRLRAEITFYRGREEHFARALGVADGGQYRADWDAAIERAIQQSRRACERRGTRRLEAEVANLRAEVANIKRIIPPQEEIASAPVAARRDGCPYAHTNWKCVECGAEPGQPCIPASVDGTQSITIPCHACGGAACDGRCAGES